MSKSTVRADDVSSATTDAISSPSLRDDDYQRGSDDPRGSYASVPTNELRISSTSARSATETVADEVENHKSQAYLPLSRPGTLRAWAPEVLALVVSTAAFVVIVVILCKLDGEVQPNLPYDLNVNTLIAIFSVMLRATLLFVIAEGRPVPQVKIFAKRQPVDIFSSRRTIQVVVVRVTEKPTQLGTFS